MIRIDGKRLLADLRELASIGGFSTGVDRVALSAPDIEARRWLVGRLRTAGLQASMDRVGNVLGRAPDAKQAILIGSHTDTVPKGGWLDGALGVGYLEGHIEQGPRMEAGGNRIAVVTGLVGIRRFRIVSHGSANHAGTTPMAMRKDAGAALIALAAAIDADMRRLAGPDTVWNIGNMIFRPGAAIVVPGEGEMLLEFRDVDAAVMERAAERFLARVAQANRGPVRIEAEATAHLAPTPLAPNLGAAIAAAAAARGEKPVSLPSGAGHDAMVVARHMPAGMMFIPSVGGISHDITENTSDHDIVFGCEVLADAVSRLRHEA